MYLTRIPPMARAGIWLGGVAGLAALMTGTTGLTTGATGLRAGATGLRAGATGLAAGAALTADAATAAAGPRPMITARPGPGVLLTATRNAGTIHSADWAGYAAVPRHPGHGFRAVSATFTLPSVRCPATERTFSVHWVGLDGFSDNTVEQAGVEARCQGGAPAYTAWWETYPHAMVVPRVTVRPGDAVTVSVTRDTGPGAHHGQYHLVLQDVTRRTGFSVWKGCGARKCRDSSAEVISEAPSKFGVLPLADYGITTFASIGVTDQAGQQGGIRSARWRRARIIQVGSGRHPRVLAEPGTLFGNGAFSNSWHRAS
jgi:Peptidase A4 family